MCVFNKSPKTKVAVIGLEFIFAPNFKARCALNLYTVLHDNDYNFKSLCILDSLICSLFNSYYSRACGF